MENECSKSILRRTLWNSRHLQLLKLLYDEVYVGVDQEIVPQGFDCNVASKLLVVCKDTGDVDARFVEDVDVCFNACRSD
jgi:hypothetical protein